MNGWHEIKIKYSVTTSNKTIAIRMKIARTVTTCEFINHSQAIMRLALEYIASGLHCSISGRFKTHNQTFFINSLLFQVFRDFMGQISSFYSTQTHCINAHCSLIHGINAILYPLHTRPIQFIKLTQSIIRAPMFLRCHFHSWFK